MPPRASSRLDLRLVSARLPCSAADLVEGLARHGVDRGSVVAGGARDLLAVEAPAERFLHSGQGGFRVSCPSCSGELTGPLSRQLEAWRVGGVRALDCPACGASHDLAGLEYRPPAAFARSWVEVVDAEDSALSPRALEVATALWPDIRVLWHRR